MFFCFLLVKVFVIKFFKKNIYLLEKNWEAKLIKIHTFMIEILLNKSIKTPNYISSNKEDYTYVKHNNNSNEFIS